MRERKKLKSDNYFELTYKTDCDVFVMECIDRTDTDLKVRSSNSNYSATWYVCYTYH